MSPAHGVGSLITAGGCATTWLTRPLLLHLFDLAVASLGLRTSLSSPRCILRSAQSEDRGLIVGLSLEGQVRLSGQSHQNRPSRAAGDQHNRRHRQEALLGCETDHETEDQGVGLVHILT